MEIAWKINLILHLATKHTGKAEGCTDDGEDQNYSGKHHISPFVHVETAIIDIHCDHTCQKLAFVT